MFLQQPSRELQETFDIIEKIDTREIKLPEELKKGSIPIGKTSHKVKLKLSIGTIIKMS